MPVVFEQPAPMAPDVTEGGGMATQFSHDLGPLVSLYNNQASNRQAGRNAAIAAGAHMQSAMIGAQVAEDQQATQDSMHAAAIQQADRHDQMQAAIASQQMAHQRDMAMLHADLATQELSQKEQMRLGQMQTALSEVMNDPTLTEQERHDAAMMLKTGIDPMVMRQRTAQAKKIEEQGRMVEEQNKRQAQFETADAATRAQLFKSRQFVVEDPVTGEKFGAYFGFDGKDHPLSELRGKVEAHDKGGDMTIQDYLKVNKDIWADIQKDQTIPQEKKAQAVADRLGGLGLPGTIAEFASQRQAQKDAVQMQSPATGQQQGVPQQPVPARPEEFKPFNPDKPETMNPVQAAQVDQLKGVFWDLMQRRDIPEATRWKAQDATQGLRRVMAQYGSLKSPHIPEDVRKLADGYIKDIEAVRPKKEVETENQAKRLPRFDFGGDGIPIGG